MSTMRAYTHEFRESAVGLVLSEGLADSQARPIGADFGQWAVFRISVDEQVVLGCFGDWVRGSATSRIVKDFS